MMLVLATAMFWAAAGLASGSRDEVLLQRGIFALGGLLSLVVVVLAHRGRIVRDGLRSALMMARANALPPTRTARLLLLLALVLVGLFGSVETSMM